MQGLFSQVPFSEPAEIHTSNINIIAYWHNCRACAWVGVSAINFWSNPGRAPKAVQFIYGNLHLLIFKMSQFHVLWIILLSVLVPPRPIPCSGLALGLLPTSLGRQHPGISQTWAQVHLPPPWASSNWVLSGRTGNLCDSRTLSNSHQIV